MKNKIIKSIIIGFSIAFVALIVVAVFVGYLGNIGSFVFSDIFVAFGKPITYIIWLGLAVVAVLWILFSIKPWSTRRLKKINNEFEDSHWLTKADMKSNDNLTVTTLSKMHTVADGIPLFAEQNKNGKDINLVIAKPIHSLVIGTTGSGKTSTFISPTIQILARSKTKPCMVITDPKGELHIQHAATLKKQGYVVQVIDLDDVYRSKHWNPFNDIWVNTDRHNNAKVRQEKGKYYFDTHCYLTFEEAERECKVFKQQIVDEVFQDLMDLIYTICPVEDKNSPGWQRGARDLILALAVGFWEDVRDGYMKREQFSLYNLYKNISEYIKNDCEEFKTYFNQRDEFSKTRGFANTVLVSQDKTLSSYLGEVNQYFNWMADTGIAALTSANDIEFSRFDEQPMALFLRIPDERENRHKLVALFITQMYKALVRKAKENAKSGKTKDEELLRNTYFLMDEFGNMPKFHKVDNIMTVGRSRKIFLVPIIQDYKLLDDKYGKDVGAIIRSQSNIKIFIGSTDSETINDFSALCGKHKVRDVSFSEQKDLSISTKIDEKPLIYPSELQKLNDPPQIMGNAIILAYGKNPLRAKFTPLFRCNDIYKIEATVAEKPQAEIFKEKDFFYDIAKYNSFVRNDKRVAERVQIELEELQGYMGDDFSNDLRESLINKEIVRLVGVIDKKVEEKLNGKIDTALLSQMIETDIESKLQIIDRLIDEARAASNKFLLFDLVYLKKYIEDLIQVPNSENTKSA